MLKWTLTYICLFQFWFPQCVASSGLAGSYGSSISSFLRSLPLFSMVTVLVCIPTNSIRGFSFLYTVSSVYCCRLLDGSHSDQCEMVPHCGFDLHFSNNEWCWVFFMCLLAICMSSLERCLKNMECFRTFHVSHPCAGVMPASVLFQFYFMCCPSEH